MRLHHLAFTAFGSFGGSETIDFDDLADAGLFLLHGPTGAGKTTILDAISFALFGTVAGVRTAGEGLRSHHSEPATPTEVRLEVTLDGRRFRITRKPKQQRPKQRGEGWREHAATATVEEQVSGTWVARAAKPNEADPYLQELLHMGVAQFHQIVMLPQGDFARFLRANADERRLVLEELFATQRFAGLERYLRQRAEADQLAVAEAEAEVHQCLVRAAAIADVEAVSRDDALRDARTWLSDLQAAADQDRDDAAAAEKVARAHHRQARKAEKAAGDLHERQQRAARARAARHELDQRAEAHLDERARRDDALRAAPVLPLVEQLNQTGARLQQLTTSVDRHRARLAIDLPELSMVDDATLANADESLLRDLGRISDLLADEAALDERELELVGLAARLAELDVDLAQLETEQLAVPFERKRLTDDLEAARSCAHRRVDLAGQVDLLTGRLEAAVERDELIGDLARVTTRRDEADRAGLDAQRRWLELLESQLASRAAALAETLEDGHPCPVCGSAEHPDPAVGEAPPISDDEVAAAKDAFDNATAAAARAEGARAALINRLAATTAAAGANAEVEALRASLTDQQIALAQAETMVELLPTLEAKVLAVDEQAIELDEQRSELAGHRVDLDKQRCGLERLLAADRTRIVRARAGFANLTERTERLQSDRQLIGALRGELAQMERADEAVLAALDRAEAEATRHGFADVTAAGAAALDAETLADLTASIDDHARSVSETEVDLQRSELMAAEALPPAAVDEARSAATQADLDLELATIRADATRKACERLASVHAEVETRLTALGPKLATAADSRRLADLANGDDRQVEHRMRLSTYVLAARLEQVAAAASDRLQTMSNGRYTIVHTDDAVDGRRKGGLGLRILDAWTSTERETSTLSGGESFFTSLALALGVADVVCAENGGVALETMFIDEGFGSLDDDTLQNVMDVLDSLRAGGRAIGIVSHVGDLRTRISSQLEVIKTASGSRLRATGIARPAVSAEPSTAA